MLFECKLVYIIDRLVSPRVQINEVFHIPTDEIQIESSNTNSLTNVPIPLSHIGKASIQCRLISAQKRQGMVIFFDIFLII